jgi:hypothetical protein
MPMQKLLVFVLAHQVFINEGGVQSPDWSSPLYPPNPLQRANFALAPMRSSAMPLVYASPPSVRKPAFKRRRLSHAIDPGCQPSRALTDNSNVAPTPTAPSLSLCAKPSCSTCHRALPTAIRPGAAGPSACSRCVVFSPARALPSKVPSLAPPGGIDAHFVLAAC